MRNIISSDIPPIWNDMRSEFEYKELSAIFDFRDTCIVEKPKPTKLSDYLIFQREVMAIGDGTVVEVGDKFPESKMNNPQIYSETFFSELIKELLPEIGFLNTVSGNYIIIDIATGSLVSMRI